MSDPPTNADEFGTWLQQRTHDDVEPDEAAADPPVKPLRNFVPREGAVIPPPRPNAARQFGAWLRSAIDNTPDPHR